MCKGYNKLTLIIFPRFACKIKSCVLCVSLR